jgi:ribosome-associated protein
MSRYALISLRNKMKLAIPQFDDFRDEITFSTARSSGPGGQNVNKVNSKVILKWNVTNSATLNEEQKNLISSKLKSRITNEGILVLNAQESRSQLANKEEVIKKLTDLLKKAFTPRKKRKLTRPTKASVIKRVKGKKLRGEKKQWRQKPDQ